MSFNPLIKVLYEEGLLLTGDLCNTGQAYPGELSCNQNIALFSSGVVAGLLVGGTTGSLSVSVAPGVAFDDQGRQLAVSDTLAVPLDNTLNGNVYIYIQYQETIDPVNHLINVNPIILQSLTAPADTNLVLAMATIEGGKLTANVNDSRTYIKMSPALQTANNIPPALMYPFAVSTNALTFTETTLVQGVTLNLPVMPFVPTQLLISAQDNNTTPVNGVFAVSVASIDKTAFTANIQFVPASSSTLPWTGTVLLNGIAWAAAN